MNEKVVFALAWTKRYLDRKTVVVMKHVGLNLVLDPLISSPFKVIRRIRGVVLVVNPQMILQKERR